MGKFNELSLASSGRAFAAPSKSESNKKVRIIYKTSNAINAAGGLKSLGGTKKPGAKSIALFVQGKPNKVRFYKDHIKAVTCEYGRTLLHLINVDQPIELRDSLEEVNYLMGRA